MKYIIMCGGTYRKWEQPRQLIRIRGEPIVVRTIRLLREAGVEDIAISSNNDIFEQFGVPVLRHYNSYDARGYNDCSGHWVDAFYPTDEPTCYIFGDVIFSPEAIKTIVETETDSIQFFGSVPPFAKEYPKPWAEPFALKVVDTDRLKLAIGDVKEYALSGCSTASPSCGNCGRSSRAERSMKSIMAATWPSTTTPAISTIRTKRICSRE